MKELMNDGQISKYDMVCALLVLFGNNPEIVAALVTLLTAITELRAEKDGIAKVAVTRDGKKSSIKNVKVNRRAGLGQYTFKYSRKLRSIGNILKIDELINLVSLPLSVAKRERFSNLAEYAAEILLLMKKYATELADQKVTPEMTAQFETMIDEYTLTLSQTDAKQAEGVGETAELEDRFIRMMAKVYIIDDIIDGIRDEYPDFCYAFDAVRLIHHYGMRHKTPEEQTIIQAKAEARKAKKALARKQKAAKVRAEKIKKLLAEQAAAEKELNGKTDNSDPAQEANPGPGLTDNK